MPRRVDLAFCTQAQAGCVSFRSLFAPPPPLSPRKTISLKILYVQMCGMLVELQQADPWGYALHQQLTVSPLMPFSQTHHSYSFSSRVHALPTVIIQLLHILNYNSCRLDLQPDVVLSSIICQMWGSISPLWPNMASSIFGINCSCLLLTIWNYAGYVNVL